VNKEGRVCEGAKEALNPVGNSIFPHEFIGNPPLINSR